MIALIIYIIASYFITVGFATVIDIKKRDIVLAPLTLPLVLGNLLGELHYLVQTKNISVKDNPLYVTYKDLTREYLINEGYGIDPLRILVDDLEALPENTILTARDLTDMFNSAIIEADKIKEEAKIKECQRLGLPIIDPVTGLETDLSNITPGIS